MKPGQGSVATRIKVLVVDDHPVVRLGIRHMIDDEPGMTVTAEAADGKEALTLLEKQAFDVVTLDLTLPQESGFDLLAAIRAGHPGLPILVISMHAEEHAALRSLQSGAAGYLCKDAMTDVLISAIRKVAGGGKFITPTLAEQLATHLEAKDKPLHEHLSPRELRVMRMLAMGTTLKAIGENLRLNIKTISTYKTRLFQKMGFQSNADLVKYALRFRMVEDPLSLTSS